MDYIYFTFDGISSKKYNLIIENQGQNLSFPSQPEFENKIVSPLFQGTNYLAGVNKTKRNFTFKCWVDSLRRNELEEMISWLSPNKVGYLILDYNPNFSYYVKLDSISDFNHLAVNDDAIYDDNDNLILDESINYSFTINFITIGNPAAISRQEFLIYDINGEYPLNEDALPIGFWDEDSKEIKFFNFYDLSTPLDFNFAFVKNFSINLNSEEYYNYNNINLNYTTLLNLKSETGMALYNNNLLESQIPLDIYVNKGPMLIPSGNKKVLYGTATWED